jgi:hypothetical protein
VRAPVETGMAHALVSTTSQFPRAVADPAYLKTLPAADIAVKGSITMSSPLCFEQQHCLLLPYIDGCRRPFQDFLPNIGFIIAFLSPLMHGMDFVLEGDGYSHSDDFWDYAG